MATSRSYSGPPLAREVKINEFTPRISSAEDGRRSCPRKPFKLNSATVPRTGRPGGGTPRKGDYLTRRWVKEVSSEVSGELVTLKITDFETCYVKLHKPNTGDCSQLMIKKHCRMYEREFVWKYIENALGSKNATWQRKLNVVLVFYLIIINVEMKCLTLSFVTEKSLRFWTHMVKICPKYVPNHWLIMAMTVNTGNINYWSMYFKRIKYN